MMKKSKPDKGIAVEGSAGSGMGFGSLPNFITDDMKSVIIYDRGESYERMLKACKYCGGSGRSLPVFHPGTKDGKVSCSCTKQKSN